MRKQAIAFFLVAGIFFGIAGDHYSYAAKKPKLNKKKVTLKLGQKTTLKVKNYKGKVKWSSSKKKIATVTKKGVVTAKKKGTAKITAKAGKKKLVCSIKVKPKEEKAKYNDKKETSAPTITPTVVPSIAPETTPSVTPVITPSVTPSVTPNEEKSDREKLVELIEIQKENGASIPTDLDDTDVYTWNTSGRLTGINWWVDGEDSNLSGELNLNEFLFLEEVNVGSGNITSIAVDKLSNLKELACDGNRLVALDVTQNTKLTSLSVGFNALYELDLSNCKELTYLYCANNKFEELDISQNTKLEYLGCCDNNISELNLSNNMELRELQCRRTNLVSLDVSSNTKLMSIYCIGNEYLKELDLLYNTELQELYCDQALVVKNALSSLDIIRFE